MLTIPKLISVALFIIVGFTAFPYIAELLVGTCLWEEGCGKGEGVRLFGVAVLSITCGLAAGYIFYQAYQAITKLRQG